MTKQEKIARLKKQINKLYEGKSKPMTRKKKKVRKGNFIARLQRTPKVRAIRAKIRKQKAVLKRLSGEYKRTLKSSARKLR